MSPWYLDTTNTMSEYPGTTRKVIPKITQENEDPKRVSNTAGAGSIQGHQHLGWLVGQVRLGSPMWIASRNNILSNSLHMQNTTTILATCECESPC